MGDAIMGIAAGVCIGWCLGSFVYFSSISSALWQIAKELERREGE